MWLNLPDCGRRRELMLRPIVAQWKADADVKLFRTLGTPSPVAVAPHILRTHSAVLGLINMHRCL